MPIKGLTDILRPTLGGSIRLGMKTQNQNGVEYPTKLDYYRFDPLDEALMERWQLRYGEKPRTIMVVFPSDDLNEVFPCFYKCYGASKGLLCKGDGERAERKQNPEKSNSPWDEVECPGPESCDYAMKRGNKGKPGCKQIGTLRFYLPDLPTLDIFQINTTSINSIKNLTYTLHQVKGIMGRLMGYELPLSLVPQEVYPDGKRTIVYVLHVHVPISLRQVQTELRPVIQFDGARVQLPPPPDELPEDLYPASQFIATTGKETVDPETGEIIEPEPEPEPERPSLADDSLVILAFDECEFTQDAREAWLSRANQAGLTSDELRAKVYEYHKTKQKAEQPPPKQAPVSPTTTTPQPTTETAPEPQAPETGDLF